MAKGKKASGKTYTSKGERPNVSRKLLNAVRTEKRKNPPVDTLIARMNHRNMILAKGSRDQKKKMEEKISIENRASELFEQFSKHGVTWAACVQAVKTDWVPSFMNRWGEIGRTAKS